MAINFNQLKRDVARLHKEADARIKGIQTVCRKGCSRCCHQHIRIVGQEGLVIEDFVSSEMSPDIKVKVRDNLLAWFDYFDAHTPTGIPIDNEALNFFERRQAQDRYPCPFLIDRSCAIYSVRPTVCRVHIETDSAENCEADPHKITETRSREIGRLILSSFERLAGPLMVRPLTYAMTEIFSIERKLKPLALLVGLSRGI